MVDRKRRLDCANGIRKADIVLKHGKVLNVFTEEILEADVAICGDTIVGVGSYEVSGRSTVPENIWYRDFWMPICILNPVWYLRANCPRCWCRRERRPLLRIRTRLSMCAV